MNRFKVVAIPVALLFWCLSLVAFIKYYLDAQSEIRQRYLDTLVNYCTDAAVEEILAAGTDLSTDYSDKDYILVDPEMAIDVFCSMFCEGMGYAQTKENFSLVKNNFVKAFAVATYDGLYIGEAKQINSGGANDIIFNMKVPYKLNGDLLNLTNVYCQRWSGTEYRRVTSPYSMQQAYASINAQISDEFTGAIFRATEGSTSYGFFIPPGITSIVRTNPIKTVSVLAYVRGESGSIFNNIDSFAVGGSKIEKRGHIAGYVRGGKKYYIETEKLKGTEGTLTMFDSPQEAAAAGYYYDLTYFEY